MKNFTLIFAIFGVLTMNSVKAQTWPPDGMQNYATVMPQHAYTPLRGDWYEPDTIYCYWSSWYPDFPCGYYVFFYENGKRTTVLLRWTTGEVGEYGDSQKDLYTYDSQNNLIEILTQEPHIEGWMDIQKRTYSYDAQNNLIEELYQEEWEGVVKDWYKKTYSYNEQNMVKEMLYESGMGSGDFSRKEIYSYNELNNLSEMLCQRLKSEQWEINSKATYTYDTYNNLIEELEQMWGSEQWKTLSKKTYKYNSQNNMIEYLWQLVVSNSNYKFTYTYDDNNNAQTGLSQFSEDGNVWYDFDYRPFPVYYNNMKTYEWVQDCYKFTATYIKPDAVSIKENPAIENSLTLYPNPVSNMLHIKGANADVVPEIKIYSMQGVLLMNAKGNQIDVTSLRSGIYIAVIDGVSRKIVKR